VQQHLANNGVSWKCIVEKVAWHGGFWERLIKSVKRCLKKSIGRATLSFEELRTILIEIESTLNNLELRTYTMMKKAYRTPLRHLVYFMNGERRLRQTTEVRDSEHKRIFDKTSSTSQNSTKGIY
jgi:hypothetical protein